MWGKIVAKIRELLSIVDWKDVGIRALKTFAETTLSCVMATLSDPTQTLTVGVISLGVTAVWNGVLEPVAKSLLAKIQSWLNVEDTETDEAETETVSTTDGSMVQVEVTAASDATTEEIIAALEQAETDATTDSNNG
jgi:hypothetical protein